MNYNPEQSKNIEISKNDTDSINENKYEKLNNLESKELFPIDTEKDIEKARAEVLETAISTNNIEKKSSKSEKTPEITRHGVIGKKQREESFKKTMKRVQNELPIPSRVFSKVIHNKVIEKTSDVVGSTIARPNSILYGAIFAFIFTLITYTVAKKIGYPLSGFESIGSFIVGWIVGIVYDYLRILITGNKS